jgi:hypothetical protein
MLRSRRGLWTLWAPDLAATLGHNSGSEMCVSEMFFLFYIADVGVAQIASQFSSVSGRQVTGGLINFKFTF